MLNWTQVQAEAIATAAYAVLLQRTPDPGGIQYWSRELLQGKVDVAGVLERFLLSDEFASKAQQLVERYARNVPPNSVHEPMGDIRRRLPGHVHPVILDVGANVGQSCIAYAKISPDASIHAFEPISSTFEALKRAIEPYSNVRIHHLALGEADGTVVMTARPLSVSNQIQEKPNPQATDQEAVPIRAGRSFCLQHGIDHVSFLKIDTEGHDLAVLKGFGDMLTATDFVQVEAAANPHNRRHVPFRVLEDFLRNRGFLLFGIYDQTFEFSRGGRPVLRRYNAVFIRGDLADVRGEW